VFGEKWLRWMNRVHGRFTDGSRTVQGTEKDQGPRTGEERTTGLGGAKREGEGPKEVRSLESEVRGVKRRDPARQSLNQRQ